MLRPVYRVQKKFVSKGGGKKVTAMRFLLLASAIVHKAYLCDGSVALQAISQGLASFSTQIIGPDIDRCTSLCLFKTEEGMQS